MRSVHRANSRRNPFRHFLCFIFGTSFRSICIFNSRAQAWHIQSPRWLRIGSSRQQTGRLCIDIRNVKSTQEQIWTRSVDGPKCRDMDQMAVEHNIDMRIIGFLNFRRTALYQFDPRLKECAFCTPRSWEHTSDLIKDMTSDELVKIQQIVSTQIGVGMAGEFATFIRVKDKLKPMDYYLKDPDNCDLPDEGTKPDLLWAL